LPGFAPRIGVRNEKLAGFCPAHWRAQRKLAGFYPRMACAPKTCRVLPAHDMRNENLPGFTHARHARSEKTRFFSSA